MNRRGFILGLGASALVLPRSPTSYFFAPRSGWLDEAPFGSFTGAKLFWSAPGVFIENPIADEVNGWEVISIDPNDSTKLLVRPNWPN